MVDRSIDDLADAACELVIRHFGFTALLAAAVSLAGMALLLN
jgi:hypothetical protein